MVHSAWRSLAPLWIRLGMAAADNECLLGFALQGLDPFASADWVGLPVCDESIAAAEVVARWCTASYEYSCFWSVVGCTTGTDTSCTCQACGGLPSDLDEYMLELPIWDRARCAVYALEESGFDITPCVEAMVDTMSMPGVIEEWTAPAVDRITCIAINESPDTGCDYAGTPRFAAEVFDDDAASLPSMEECLLGFALQGLDPFASADWVGLPVCDESIAAAEVVARWCTASYEYSCFWSVVGCTTGTDTSCTCQACGGLPSDLDEYMLELPIWDRARCAVYALEESGFDITPCVEAMVDTMSMPGVIEEWTAPAVDRITCIAINESPDTGCDYAGTPRFAAEVFDDDAASLPSMEECLLGFALQGLDPFASADWVGLPVCDESIAAAEVVARWCTASYEYSCFWSVVGCTTGTDTSCTCQACGGLPSDLDEYMLELPIWDRARCAVYALEESGFDITPCVEAMVDTMSMPGVIEEWTAPAVEQTACIAIDDSPDTGCDYAGTPRFAAEVFHENVSASTATPAPRAAVAPASTSFPVTVSPAPSSGSAATAPAAEDETTSTVTPAPILASETQGPAAAEDGTISPAFPYAAEGTPPPTADVTTTSASPSLTETSESSGNEGGGADGPADDDAVAGSTPAPSTPSNGGKSSGPPVASGDVFVSTGGGDGLATWATVVSSFAGVIVAAFVAWYGYRRHTSSPAGIEFETSQ